MTITKPGIYNDFPIDVYMADPCPGPSLNQSIAKVLLDRSPAHAKLAHPRLAPPVAADDEESPEKYDKAKAIGSAAHALLIGRGSTIAAGVFDSWRGKEAGAFKEKAQGAGQIVILDKHLKSAVALANQTRTQCHLAGWTDAFQNGSGEVVLAWQEPDGLWCRALVDWLNVVDRKVYDLKSTGMSVAPHAVGKLGADAGWDIQAAMIERGLHALMPEAAGRWTFRFPAIENDPPYAMTPVELSEHWLTMGRKKIDMAMAIWRDCLKRDLWPGYPLDPLTPEYPGWKESQWLGREIAFHDDRPPTVTDRSAENMGAG